MFNQAKFKDYVTSIDAHISKTLPQAIAINKKYRKHYQLQTNRFLRRFDADITNPKKSLEEICSFVYDKYLCPNFFEVVSDDFEEYSISCDFLEPFLVWNTFNEKAHLQLHELKKKPYLVSNILRHVTR